MIGVASKAPFLTSIFQSSSGASATVVLATPLARTSPRKRGQFSSDATLLDEPFLVGVPALAWEGSAGGWAFTAQEGRASKSGAAASAPRNSRRWDFDLLSRMAGSFEGNASRWRWERRTWSTLGNLFRR